MMPASAAKVCLCRRTDTFPMSESTTQKPSPFSQHPPERRRQIEWLRWITLGCVVGLIGLGLAWELWLAPLKGGTGALALKVVPLCFAVAGVLKHRMYTYRWLSLLVWLYFTEGTVRASSDTGLSQQLAMVETALSVMLFASCAVYVRLRLRVLPPKQKGEDSAS